MTITETLIDTSEMPTLHTFYRREYRLAGELVRRVPGRDLKRASAIADHVELVGRSLHHHHTVEDELLWPLLLARVPEEIAPLVHLMESQHRRVDALLTRSGELASGFRVTADPERGERLADLLDDLYVHLIEHLDAEEHRVLPIVARTITQPEWAAMNEAGRAGTARNRQLLMLGMYQYEGDPRVIAAMLGGAPAPLRRLLPRLARRAFARYSLRIHGTTTP